MKKICFLLFLLAAMFNSQSQNIAEKLKPLDFLIGEWSIITDTRLSAQGPWEKSQAVSVIKKALHGSLIEEEYTGSRSGKPFLAKNSFARNNMNDNFQRVFIDSEHGVLVDYEGKRNADTLFFDKTWRYQNGNTVKLRIVYRVLSANSFVLESMRMPEGTSQWDITERFEYTRRK